MTTATRSTLTISVKCASCMEVIQARRPVYPVMIGTKKHYRCGDCGPEPKRDDGPVMVADDDLVRNVSTRIQARLAPWQDNMEAMCRDAVKEAGDGAEARAWAVVRQTVEECQRLIQEARVVQHIITLGPETVELPEGEVVHPIFDEVIEAATDQDNVYLAGPAGCGKSHLAGQVARVLGRRFDMISGASGITETALVGRMGPNVQTGGYDYTPSSFVTLYRDGGVFLADEIDRFDPLAICVLNSALANGRMALPNGEMIERHPDFVLIATGNSAGGGATRLYEVNKMCASLMDRFVVFAMTYSPEIEKALCRAQGAYHAYDLVVGWRAAMDQAGVCRTLTTRGMVYAARHLARGRSVTWVAHKLTRSKGWTRDEMVKVLGATMAQEVWDLG